MARHWTNSKGLGYDYDRGRRNQLEKLRRDCIPGYGVRKSYNRTNNKPQTKVENKQK